MNNDLQFAYVLFSDGTKRPMHHSPAVLRALGIEREFRWTDPEGFTRAIVERLCDVLQVPIFNVRIFVNRSFNYAEITAHGFNARWQNPNAPLVALSDNEKVNLYCDAERYYLGTCFSQKERESF